MSHSQRERIISDPVYQESIQRVEQLLHVSGRLADARLGLWMEVEEDSTEWERAEAGVVEVIYALKVLHNMGPVTRLLDPDDCKALENLTSLVLRRHVQGFQAQ